MNFPCPPAVLPRIADQLRVCGCKVIFLTDTEGMVVSIAGKIGFNHDGKVLRIGIIENAGHFSRSMLIGGIRQVIEEAVESHQAASMNSCNG